MILLDFGGVPWLGVIVATVASVVIGMLWYARFLFGNAWMAALGRTEAEMTELQKSMGPGYVLAIVGSFLSSLVMAMVLGALGEPGVGDAIITAIVLSIAFQVAMMATGNVFAGAKPRLTIINGLNAVVILVAQAVVITVLR